MRSGKAILDSQLSSRILFGLLLVLFAPRLLVGQTTATLTVGNVSGAPGSTVNIPLTLTLNQGTVTDLSFGLRVINNGNAPALTTGILTFTKAAALPAPGFVTPDPLAPDPSDAHNEIAVSWLSGLSLSGANISLGTVNMTIPAGAANGQTYTIRITGASATAGTPATFTTFVDATATVVAPVITVNPTSLTFTGTQGASNPANQTVSITNTGGTGTTLNWTRTVSVTTPQGGTWLSASPASGATTQGGAASTLTVSVDITGLTGSPTGTAYNGTIQIAGTGAATQSISVTVTITTPPTISLNPTTLNFSATQGGGNPADQTVSISNSGGGTLNWTRTVSVTTPSGGTWLSATPASGTAPSTLTVSVNITGLTGSPTGTTYTGSIQIAAAGAGNTPQTIPVTLVITTAPTVTSINRAAASPSNATSVSWTVTFSVSVTGVDATDFTLASNGVTGASITGVTGTGSSYTVTAGTGTGDGTIGLNLVDDDSIQDAGSIKLGGTGAGNGNFTGQVYTIDKTAPTVTITKAQGQADPTTASPINFTVTFSEAVTGFDGNDVTITGTAPGTKTVTVTGGPAVYNAAVSGMTLPGGTVIAGIGATVATDLAGNANTAAPNTATVIFGQPPAVTISRAQTQADPTNATTINLVVVFSEPVTGFATGDVTLSGTAGATTATVTAVDTSNYTVAVTGMTGQGTVIATILQGVANSVATGLPNAASNTLTVNFDNVPPTVTVNVAAGQESPTLISPVNFTVVFSEAVASFTAANVTLTGTAGGTKTVTVTGTGPTYNVAIGGLTASAPGTVIVTIAAGAVNDLAGNPNTASTGSNTLIFGAAPTVTINQAAGQADPTNGTTINFTAVFSEAVTGFTNAGVTTSAGTATFGTKTVTVTGGPTTYTVAVSGMTGTGTVIATIPAAVATSTQSGLPNAASTSTDNTVTFDITPPTVTISKAATQNDPTNATTINFTVVFNETVTGFATGDVTLGGTAGATTATVTPPGDGTTFNVAVSGMTQDGTVTATIGSAVAKDLAGNDNQASNTATVTFDTTRPTVTINQAQGQADPTSASPINFTVVFSEPVTGFTAAGVTLSGTVGGTKTVAVTGSGANYTVAVSGMNGTGTLIATIPAGAANDLAGNPNVASTSTDNTVNFDNVPPTVTINRAAGQSEVTNAEPINFTAVFNKPVTGFTGAGVTVGGIATFGTKTVTVTGTGATYNVAVGGMTGSGTVIATVNAGAANSVTGVGNVASTSTQNTVTFDNAPPTAPGTLTATANGTTQIGLSWTASTDNIRVAGYLIERCQGASCSNFVQVATTGATVTTYNDAGLSAGTSYSYRVRATDGFNLGSFSTVATATTQAAADTTPPTAPGNLTATAFSTTQINLSWTASTDAGGVTGYLVERCQGASCSDFVQVATPSATATTYNDTILTPSTSYSYRVRATDAAPNLSAYAGPATATTLTPADTQVPTTPTNLSALSVSKSQIDLSWTASTDAGGSGLAGYLLERCEGSGCASFVQIAALPATAPTTYSDAVLFANTTYSYRVRATDGAANLSAYSDVASATTQAVAGTTPPTPPGGLSRVPAEFSLIRAGTTDDPDEAEPIYSTKSVTVVSSTQISLGWNASTSPSGVSGYLVERCQGAGCLDFAQIATTAGTSYNDTGLLPSTTYSYRVRAIDTVGNVSQFSSVATATTQAGTGDTTPPNAPANPTATVIGTTQINLAWTAATDNVGVTGYIVERCQGANCVNFAQIAPQTGTTLTGTAFNNTGLVSNTSYSYRVKATDAALNVSGFFSVVTATTQAAADTTPPTAPANLTATAVSSAQINLSWTAATDDVAVTGYLVERCQNAGCLSFAEIATVTGTPPATAFSNTGLTPDTSYSYRVRARDAAPNVSNFASVATAKTPPAPLIQTPPPAAGGSGGGGAVVSPRALLSVGPATLSFSGLLGVSLSAQQLAISGSGDKPLNWTASVNTVSGGNWLILSSTSGTTPATVDVSVNPAGLREGTYQGTITISSADASNSPLTVNVTLALGTPTIRLAPAALVFTARRLLSPAAQTFEVRNTGAGALGWSAAVTTQSGGNWLSVSPTTGVAPSTVTVNVNSTNLAPGSYSGTITITSVPSGNASNSPQVLPVGLVIDAPAVAQGGLVNAASFARETGAGGAPTVSPGSIVSLFGTNLSTRTATASAPSSVAPLAVKAATPTAAVLPTVLADTQVLVNGIPAPLFYVSPTQINFQMPPGLSGTTAEIVVVSGGVRGLSTQVALAPELPGVFSVSFDGKGQGAVLNENSSANSAENSALAGTILQIFATGLGATNPPVAAGEPGPTSPLSLTVGQPVVLINGEPAEILYSGLAPGFVGAYQVNARIPARTSANPAVTLQIQIGGKSSNTVTIAVR